MTLPVCAGEAFSNTMRRVVSSWKLPIVQSNSRSTSARAGVSPGTSAGSGYSLSI